MEKTIIIMSFLIVILAGLLALIFIENSQLITGEAVLEQNLGTYSYTKAICNKDNFCQDYVIKCESSEIQDMAPIKNAYVQHNKEWEDPREKRELCYRE